MFSLVQSVSSQYYYDQSYGYSGFNFPLIDLSFGDFVQFYGSNYQWLDFFLILALLIGISKLTIEDKLGKLTPVILAIILSISFVVFERQADFNLGDFGPVAFLVFILTVLIFVLLLFKKIHSAFNMHGFGGFGVHRGRITTVAVLLGLSVLVILFISLRNTDISSLSTGQVFDILINEAVNKILALLVFAAIIGIIILMYRSGWIRRDSVNTETRPPTMSFFRNTPEKKEFKEIAVLVSDFIRNTQDPESKEDFISRRLDATRKKIAEFKSKYMGSKFEGSVNELIAKIEKSYEYYSAKDQIKEHVEQTANYLESLLNKNETLDNLLKAKEYISSYHEEYKNYLKSNEALNARLNSLIKQLDEEINQKKLGLAYESNLLEEKQRQKNKPISSETIEHLRKNESLKKPVSQETIQQFRDSEIFNELEENLKSFFSSCHDIVEGRLSKENFTNIYNQTLTQIYSFINSSQSENLIKEAKRNVGEVKRAYNLSLLDYQKMIKVEQQKTLNVLARIKELMLNKGQYNSLSKEAKKFFSLVINATSDDKSVVEGNYNKLIDDITKFSEKAVTFRKKLEKLSNEIKNKKELYDQKILLQSLIDQLTYFVSSIGTGEKSIKESKKVYADSRKIFTEIWEGIFRDELKQGLDISYELIKKTYDYISEVSSLNLIEHEIMRIREKIRNGSLSAQEGKMERDNLMPRLESITAVFKSSQVRKAALLGELRSGY